MTAAPEGDGLTAACLGGQHADGCGVVPGRDLGDRGIAMRPLRIHGVLGHTPHGSRQELAILLEVLRDGPGILVLDDDVSLEGPLRPDPSTQTVVKLRNGRVKKCSK